ncbi:tetratricopeptide repeat protein [Robertmurraya sp. GLU-23]
MLKPKRSIKQLKETASRQFTDREEPRRSYINAFQSLSPEPYKVLVYYGVGGIGKSRLQKELQHMTSSLDHTAIQVTIDFREEKHRDPSEALIWMRQQLTQEHHIKFTTFDLAYAIYWSRMKSQITMKSERKTIPFLEEGSFVAELITQLENLPVVQWIPKTIKLIDGLSNYRDVMQWWNGIGKEILADLKDMHPKDIEDMLLVYWAADVMSWLEKNNRKAVFFFDTYEALWEKDRSIGSFHERDEWIKELILQFDEVSVLNVICGREKLVWEKSNSEWKSVVEQHLMGELSPTDCKSFLNSCLISDEHIQEAIIQGSEGLPYYLDLMVDTYQLISRKQVPEVADFSKSPEEVLHRFLKYLDRPEKETLKILSVPRFWTEDLFVELVTEFKTFYPVTAFPELCEFSFIQELELDGSWSMHKLMKQGLYHQVEDQTPSLFQQVHRFLHTYYSARLEHQEELPTVFVEALHHGERVLSSNELVDWLSKYSVAMTNNGHWSSLINEYERLMEEYIDWKLQTLVQQGLCELYLLNGQYELAEKRANRAIQLFQIHGEGQIQIAYLQKKLGDLYRNTNNYEKAVYSFVSAIHELEKIEEDPQVLQEIAWMATRLGKIYKLQSKYDLAQQSYQLALDKCSRLTEWGEPSAETYATLGQVHEKLGELQNDEGSYGEDLHHFYQSIQAYEQALSSKGLKDTITIRAHQGLAYKRLAEAISDKEEKLAHFHQAISIYNEVIEKAPEYVDGYEMRGHASVDLLDLYADLDQFRPAYESFQLAVESFEKALELSEVQGSSRNRLSSAYRSLGRLYRKQKNYSLAIEAFQTSLIKSDELFQHSPEYIYAHNSRGKIYREMGDCYLDMKEVEQAVSSYKESVVCFKKQLEHSPGSKTAMVNIERLEKLIVRFLT